MSVLIKGMEMPKGCCDCPFQRFTTNIVGYVYVCCVVNKEIEDGNESWCPLVEVPTPHGRLIDADDIDNHIIGSVDTRDCPTVIEAEGEDEKED